MSDENFPLLNSEASWPILIKFYVYIMGVGERLHKVLWQIDIDTLDSGERSLPFGLLVFFFFFLPLPLAAVFVEESF